MSRSRKGGRNGGLLKQAASAVVIGAVILGFFGVPARPDVKDFPELLESKSATVQAWMKNCAPLAIKGDFSKCSLIANVEGGGSSAGGATPVNSGAVSAAEKTLSSLKQAPAESIDYNRDEWNHWVASGTNSCWNVREAVLFDEAEKGSAVLKDKAGNVVDSESKACSIEGGKWTDPYTGAVFTDPAKLDIDHMIPLGYAAKHGGQVWDKNKKQKYANDMSYTNHLIAASAGANRAKSDQGPSAWKPASTAYHCEYAVNWITISKNYNLTVDAADAAALKTMLATC
jgi:hypothetical protein